jgi:hypothetical protein
MTLYFEFQELILISDDFYIGNLPFCKILERPGDRDEFNLLYVALTRQICLFFRNKWY